MVEEDVIQIVHHSTAYRENEMIRGQLVITAAGDDEKSYSPQNNIKMDDDF